MTAITSLFLTTIFFLARSRTLRTREPNILRISSQEQVHQNPSQHNKPTRNNKRPAPTKLKNTSSHKGPADVTNRRVSIPNTHYQTPLPLPKPVSNHCNHRRPPGGLKQPSHHLHHEIKPKS
ncbi:hypothetical protein PanWU01x14_123270, partial [Parasponia andersonii]